MLLVNIPRNGYCDAEGSVSAVGATPVPANNPLAMHRFVLFVLCSTVVAAGQQVAPRFEVASVKPLKPDSDAGGGGFFPGGRFAVSGATVQELVRLAYGVADYQILNAPGWATTEKYVIDARAGDGAPTRQEVLRMLQSLLADRFKLVVHSDSREMAAYVLEMARLDKSLGNQLRRSTIDCSTAAARERARAALPRGRRACATYMDGSSFLADGVEFTTLTTLMSSSLQAPIDDRTGLKGLFDWELRWSRDLGKEGPSLLVAVEEQFGLRLRPTRAPVSILVIESLERPTPD